MYKLEIHVHTKFSYDSLLSFWGLYFKCRLKKIDYIAITDHNSIDGAVKFDKFCKKHKNKLNVIIGEEIMTSKGEIIGLFLKQKIAPGSSPVDTIKKIKKQEGIVYIPHPYDEKRYKTVLEEQEIEKNVNYIDCIENYNGRNISEYYGIKQNEIAEKYGLLKVIGSDAHTMLEVGRNYIDISIIPSDPCTFINAVKTGVFHKKKCILFCHFITKVAKIINIIRKGNFDELYRIVIRKYNKRK